jgi:2-dehydro-3-deoxygalactonokinase
MSGSTDWADGFIAVDWGTTNRRGYALDSSNRCINEFEDDKGILNVTSGGFEEAVCDIRTRLGEKPMLLGGMIGSNRGWIEASYVACPAGIDDLAESLVWVEERRTAIVPGVADKGEQPDVMRGEEVQLLGAVADGQIPQDCLICHPGTHNKWVRVVEGRIESFRTVMTGELFSLLAKHSILSDWLNDEAMDDAPFRAGVRQGLEARPLASELFGVRASVLLGRLPKEQAVAFTSGLLIGQDVHVGSEHPTELPVIVMGRPDLTRLYRTALSEAGVEATEVDGEKAFIAGARSIVERMQ